MTVTVGSEFLQCKFCDEMICGRTRMGRHMKALHVEEGMKWCARCEEIKPVESFGIQKSSGAVLAYCRPCASQYVMNRRRGGHLADNPCSMCPEVFGPKYLLTNHLKEVHDVCFCPRCLKYISAQEFRYYEGSGGSPYCKPCHYEYARERMLRVTYNVSLHDYQCLLEKQDFACKTCLTKEPGGQWDIFVVDHDHECCPGKISCGNCVRGLLCMRCNMDVGQLEKFKKTGILSVYLTYIDGV